MEIQVRAQQRSRAGIDTRRPADSSTSTAATPTSGEKWLVKVSTNRVTGDPAPAAGDLEANQSRKVRGAKRGSARRRSTPAP